jgi:hypothetical protein
VPGGWLLIDQEWGLGWVRSYLDYLGMALCGGHAERDKEGGLCSV